MDSLNERILADTERYFYQLINSVNSKQATINGESVRVYIEQKQDSNYQMAKIITQADKLKRGEMIVVGDTSWLVTTVPEDNGIYKKAEITLCNETVPMVTGSERVEVGRDDRGRPIYDYIETTEDVPVIFTERGLSAIKNDVVTVPDGFAEVYLKYNTEITIAINTVLTFKGKSFKVTDYDYEQVIGTTGLLKLRLQRTIV